MVEELKKDMVEAMKNHEKERLAVIRAVKAGMDKERIDNKREVNDELLIDVVNREIKMRKESIVEFEKGNREDLVNKYQSEIDILSNKRSNINVCRTDWADILLSLAILLIIAFRLVTFLFIYSKTSIYFSNILSILNFFAYS